MLINRTNWRLQIIPSGLAVAATMPLIGWYLIESWNVGRWLGGGSLPAIAMGTAATLIIAFEMMLWPRKVLRRLRLIPAKYWMSCHIWFGIASLPLSIFHSGLHWGGWLATLLIVSLLLTVLSGVYGTLMQNFLPSWMLKQLPAETIASEIEHVAAKSVEDADNLLRAACGPREQVMTVQFSMRDLSQISDFMDADGGVGMTRAIVIGAPREAGRLRGRSLDTKIVTQQKLDARSLWSAYDEVRPYLKDGTSKSQIFGSASRSDGWFRLLRHACSADSERVIGPLENLVDQRRQFNTQRRMHLWLHAWLPIHIGISTALCVLLVTHILSALRYW
jgi:hypothetical protein